MFMLVDKEKEQVAEAVEAFQEDLTEEATDTATVILLTVLEEEQPT